MADGKTKIEQELEKLLQENHQQNWRALLAYECFMQKFAQALDEDDLLHEHPAWNTDADSFLAFCAQCDGLSLLMCLEEALRQNLPIPSSLLPLLQNLVQLGLQSYTREGTKIPGLGQAPGQSLTVQTADRWAAYLIGVCHWNLCACLPQEAAAPPLIEALAPVEGITEDDACKVVDKALDAHWQRYDPGRVIHEKLHSRDFLRKKLRALGNRGHGNPLLLASQADPNNVLHKPEVQAYAWSVYATGTLQTPAQTAEELARFENDINELMHSLSHLLMHKTPAVNQNSSVQTEKTMNSQAPIINNYGTIGAIGAVGGTNEGEMNISQNTLTQNSLNLEQALAQLHVIASQNPQLSFCQPQIQALQQQAALPVAQSEEGKKGIRAIWDIVKTGLQAAPDCVELVKTITELLK